MRSPWPYLGGKAWLVPYLEIPPHDVYVELFLGGGAVYWGKEPVEVNVLNDIDPFVYNAWIVLKNWNMIREEVLMQPWYLFSGRETRSHRNNLRCVKQEAIRYTIQKYPDVRAFFLFFVRQKIGINGVSWGSSFRILSRDLEKSLLSSFSTFDQYCQKLNTDNVIIYRKDFREVVDEYKNNSRVFFYVDPPYTQAFGPKYYGFQNSYKMVNAITPDEVAKSLAGVKGKWAVSYNNTPIVIQAFQRYCYPIAIDSYRVHYARHQYVEIVIRNYGKDIDKD